MRALSLAAAFLGLLLSHAAWAAMEVPARAVWSVTDVDTLQFCDKCDPAVVSSATRAENYKRTIADTVALGSKAILVHAITGSATLVRLEEFAKAVVAYNATRQPADQVCMALMLADYNPSHLNADIDAFWLTSWTQTGNGAAYCAIGGRPVVATLEDRSDFACQAGKYNNIFGNRLRVLAGGAGGFHWIAAFGESSEFADWDTKCRAKLTGLGANVVYSYLEMANDNPTAGVNATTRRATVVQGGGRYILGIPTASGRNCGDFCGANDSPSYQHTDFAGFGRTLAAWLAPIDDKAYTFGPGGPASLDQFVSTSLRCDANDLVTSAAACVSADPTKAARIPGVPENPTVPVSAQCSTLQPPAAAVAAGVTRLDFCDDFSTDTVARGPNATDREIVGGKKWTTERATGWGNTPTAASSFTFNPDGTLTVIPDRADYNWFISSTASRNGAIQGYYMPKQAKRYVEIRWKFRPGTATVRQPGFWSMDTCHLYGLPAQCPGTVRQYIEDDWWEYTDQNSMGFHFYHEYPGGVPATEANPQGQQSCGGKRPEAASPGDNIWFTAGQLFNVDRQDFLRNGQVYFTRTASGTCYRINPNWTMQPAGYMMTQMLESNLPLLVGSRPGEIIDIDYVAVWLP